VNFAAPAVDTAALTDTTDIAAHEIDATASKASGRSRRRDDAPDRDATL
jgi:hypothetical protein